MAKHRKRNITYWVLIIIVIFSMISTPLLILLSLLFPTNSTSY